MMKRCAVWLTVLVGLGVIATPVEAETLCDPAYQDCRTPLLTLINNETVGIDVAFWFMQDTRYETALLNRWKAGVPIRVLVDPRANPTYSGNAQVIADLAAAGIPIRYRLPSTAGILHWKMMLFAGQNQVEFDGANYSPTAFVYQSPYSDYEWESIYFSDDPSIVNSFKTEYDNLWLDTTNYGNYANVNGSLTRLYPIYTKDPALNFPQQEDYALRILKNDSKETQGIDVIMYRITDERHTNAMIAALQRGVPVRLISDTFEYRNPSRLWVAYNLDKLYAAGIPLKVRGGNGLNHQKLVILYSQAMAVFGSSNWTTPSANQQQEHNYFTTKSWMFQWFTDQFNRKWNNLAPNGAIESTPFVPLPPDAPNYLAPADGAVGIDRSLELHWDGGPWGQVYDVYFGTDPNPPLLASNEKLGPTDPATPTLTQKWILPLLQPGTTYYWRIVSKTMAGLAKSGPIASFTTAGTPPPPPTAPSGSNTIVIWTATDVPQPNVIGNWQFLADSTAAGGRALWNPDHGMSKISPPLATPANYFSTTFNALGGVAYHVWLRLRAQNNSISNNSVSFQFNDAVDQYGSPLYRIGTAEGGETILTDPSGTLNNWGWADNGQGGSATLVYFPATGPHTIQIQQRSDGAIVDQVVLSPDAFLASPPGATLNDSTIYGSTIDGAAPPPALPVVPPPPPPIPAPWQQQDIGNVGMPGYASFDDGSSVFTDEAAGSDIWGNADAFHYIYMPLSGDGTIVARVASLQNTNAWTKAGVMIRQDLTAGSANVFALVSSAKGTYMQVRATAGGTTTNAAGATKAAPYWVKLTRAGNTFTAAESPDGLTWTTVGTTTLTLTSTTFVGLALTSHNVDATAVATFDNVSVNGSPVCGYSVSPSGQSVDPSGGTVSVALTTGPSCPWTATSTDTWLTVTSAASGTGTATITASAAVNTSGARNAAITAAGQSSVVNQGAATCSYSISPSSQAFSASGGSGSFAVSTGSWCTWNAASDSTWLTMASGSSGTGNATIVFNVDVNSAGARAGTITVGGQAFTVTEDAAACSYSITPTSQSFSASGGNGTVAVTTGSWCSWTATSNDTTWLSVTSGASGTGNGTVTLSAATNNAGSRSATATIAGQTLSATQSAAACTYTISPGSQSFGNSGGTTTVNVTTGSWCSWTAASNDPTWLTITSGASGTGNGSVSLTASPNSAGARSTTATIAGQSFGASEAAAACTYTITPSSAAMAYGGDTATVSVATGSWCSWTATSNASWLTIGSGASGTGSGSVTVNAQSNMGGPRSATATIATQTFTANQAAPPSGLPTGWSNQDIGAVGVAGATTFNGGVFTVTGAGADVWGTADALQYAYTSMTGDGSIVARVASVQNTNAWTKAGAMIRESVDPSSAQGFMLVSFSKGLAYQRRLANGGTTTNTSGATGNAPYWVRVDRVGNTVTAYQSTDGASWSFVDTDTLSLPSTVYIGLGVSSHSTTATATCTFDNVTVTPGTPTSPTPLPSGWSNADIGTTGIVGTSAFSTPTSAFSVKGGGADIYGVADAFQFAYKPMTGDGVIVARVTGVQNTNGSAKGAVMIRASLSAGSANAAMVLTATKGAAFQRRLSTGGSTVSTAGAVVTAPYWVKLERIGNTFNGYSSPDGVNWTLVGSDTIAMGASVYVGLAATSHTTTTAALVTFAQVTTP